MRWSFASISFYALVITMHNFIKFRAIVWCVHLIQVDTYRNLISQSYWNHKTGYFGCSQKFSNACNHHGCSDTRRSESSSSWPDWWRSSVEAPATQPAASGTDVGHLWEGGCCSWLCDPAHPRGSQSGCDRDCMLATPFCWHQTAAGKRWPPLPCGGERCHPGRQPSVLSAAV